MGSGKGSGGEADNRKGRGTAMAKHAMKTKTFHDATIFAQDKSIKTMETIGIGAAWFISSAVFSTWANTAFLNEFESTIGHTFVRFVGASILSACAMGSNASGEYMVS